MYWPCQPTATLPSAGAAVGSAARGASTPTEGGEGCEHIVAAARLQLVTFDLYTNLRHLTITEVYFYPQLIYVTY